MKISGQYVDVQNRDIFPARITVKNGKIDNIEKVSLAPSVYILPGLIDTHIHIESSMVTPGSFALAAVRHGTIGVVSDPHEIANVMGKAGVYYMMEDSNKVPLKFWFGAPSCVPATCFETNGAVLNCNEIRELLEKNEIHYLAEMMNFPGVIFSDKEVAAKLEIARELGKPIDGHAPGLKGEMLKRYISAGISTDHECSSMDEALEKISLGMKILIREGSAARNLKALKGLYKINPGMLMLCSDDLHPEMLEIRHINKLVASLISEGFDVFDVVRSATVNPMIHYNLDSGLLKVGQNADFILVDELKEMNVLETWINGVRVFADGNVEFSYSPGEEVNNFNCSNIRKEDLLVANKTDSFRVIEAFEGELLTKQLIRTSGIEEFINSDIKTDTLKIVVKDRYTDSPPSVGFINGFNLKVGAFASSVSHDSHNIIAIGTNDTDITNSINEIVRMKGGLAVSAEGILYSLQLNIAGIMSTRTCKEVAKDYLKLNELLKSFGCTMSAPFMTLSFMALLVIPDLKIGDRGLFDVNKFEITPLFISDQPF